LSPPCCTGWGCEKKNPGRPKQKTSTAVLIDPPNFSTIHVTQEKSVVSIYVRDHATITIGGKFHETPMVMVDSNEYPTRLEIR